jgi:hypothetical protein
MTLLPVFGETPRLVRVNEAALGGGEKCSEACVARWFGFREQIRFGFDGSCGAGGDIVLGGLHVLATLVKVIFYHG